MRNYKQKFGSLNQPLVGLQEPKAEDVREVVRRLKMLNFLLQMLDTSNIHTDAIDRAIELLVNNF